MKAIKFAQSQASMNDWEYKVERQQQKKESVKLRSLKKSRKSVWQEA